MKNDFLVKQTSELKIIRRMVSTSGHDFYYNPNDETQHQYVAYLSAAIRQAELIIIEATNDIKQAEEYRILMKDK